MGSGRASDWYHEPEEALLAADLPVLTPLVRRWAARHAAHRRALIARHAHPTISVVMAAHNAEATIEAALRSLCDQTHVGLEILVVDDASDDATPERVEMVAATDDRVRLLRRRTRGGAASARNLGMQAADGDYITFQDADDTSHPERLERQLAALLENPRAAVCLCNGRRVDAMGRTVQINGRRETKCMISMMFPRRVRERLGFFRASLPISEDSEYFERIKVVYGDEAELRLYRTLYVARFSPGSLLFSDGTTEVDGQGHVTHRRSPGAEDALKRIAREHERIRAGERDAYVPFEPER